MEIGNRNLLIMFGLLFALGVLLAVSNAYCAINIGHVFAPLLYGIALVSLAAGGAIAMLFQWRIDKMQLERVISVLPEEERKVLKVVIDKKTVSQTDLRYLSGLSKVRVSRIISRLEQRSIIEKKPFGNTNMVILKI